MDKILNFQKSHLKAFCVIAFILAMIVSIKHLVRPKSALGIFGFSVGENKTASLKNMEKLGLTYVSYKVKIDTVLAGQGSSIALSHPERCEEQVTAGLSIVGCVSPKLEGAHGFLLYFYEDTLVKIILEIAPGETPEAYAKVSEKFGTHETALSPNSYTELNNVLRRAGVAGFLMSPTDTEPLCENCSLSRIIQDNANDGVWVERRSTTPNRIVIVNAEIIVEATKETDRKVAAEKQKFQY